jgi:hypothetical protein
VSHTHAPRPSLRVSVYFLETSANIIHTCQMRSRRVEVKHYFLLSIIYGKYEQIMHQYMGHGYMQLVQVWHTHYGGYTLRSLIEAPLITREVLPETYFLSVIMAADAQARPFLQFQASC